MARLTRSYVMTWSIIDSVKAFVRVYNLPLDIVSSRLRGGMKPEDAISMSFQAKSTSVVYVGVRYESIVELSKAVDISYHKLAKLLR